MLQNIFDLAESEKGALKYGKCKPAKFDCKIFSALILTQDNAVNKLVTLLFLIDHWLNFGFRFSCVLILKVNVVFITIGNTKNTTL